jgi:pyridoxine kinase
MENIKKVAAIHDMSGLGRCSLTAVIPILSVLKVQCCPFPTAILSCQSQYPVFSFLDLTDEMLKIEETWDKLNIGFDCIYSGFLGSESQLDIVADFVNKHKDAKIIIDPVMGDNGHIYKTYTNKMCEKMKDLVTHAHIVTPNLTEACIITGREYDVNLEYSDIKNIVKEVSDMGPKQVVITGVVNGDSINNVAYDRDKNEYYKISYPYNNKSFGGTGDIFASIICGMTLNGYNFRDSVQKASDFVFKAIKYTEQFNIEIRDGVVFEPLLKELIF